MQKILFISHDASRTGAPILLLNLVKLVLDYQQFQVNFLLKNGGILETEFKEMAPTYQLYKNKVSKIERFTRKIFKTKSLLDNKEFLAQYDFIISNTITNGDVLEKIRLNYSGKIISYIHELEIASKTYTTSIGIEKVIKNSDTFWVPSLLVKDFLCQNFNLSDSHIVEIPYYIESKKKSISDSNQSDNTFIVGGCGTIDWRKGPDLFLQVARNLFLQRPDAAVVFQWKGANEGMDLTRLEYQIKKANLEGKVLFETASSNLDLFFERIDLFLLTSREDPYPLVILEAAQFAKPSICFDEVCGSKDFIINSGGGDVVPFLDISTLVDVILSFYDNPMKVKEKGENAKNKLMSTHSEKEYVYKEFKKGILS